MLRSVLHSFFLFVCLFICFVCLFIKWWGVGLGPAVGWLVWLLLYAHRHRSILEAAGHIILTPANQLMEEYSEPPEQSCLLRWTEQNSLTLLWPEWGSNPIPSDPQSASDRLRHRPGQPSGRYAERCSFNLSSGCKLTFRSGLL
jgi:hypothetical protein